MLVLVFMGYSAHSHSVQVTYCANCNGDLRIWVEHWHSTEDINSTTMTLEVTVNGVTTTQTGSPNTGVQDTPKAGLPGCSTPLTVFGSCPNYANTYNDWVAYDFTGMPTGVPINIKIISGNSAFTDDGCGMYPAETGVIIIDPPPAVSNQVGCSGSAQQPIGPFTFAQGNTWTNDNTAIGLPASGTGDIPAFIPPASPTTQVANITISNTCGTSSFTITVKPSPTPNFTAPGILGNTEIPCPGLPVAFNDLSTPVSGSSIASWTWDFGDGSAPVTAQNPTHTFPLSPTTYTVTLTSTDANGCSPDTSLVIDISGPNAEFTASNVCDGQNVSYTDASTPSSDITNWKWDFNSDGIIDNTTQNPSHLFSSSGSYQTELLVQSSAGCWDSVTHTIIVNPNPVASFTATNQCITQTTSFTNNSSIVSGAITQWNWNFNDSSPTSAQQTPSHTYATHGTYNVLLTATSDSGCVDTASQNVNVFDTPVANFSFGNVCKYDSAVFINSSSNPTMGTIASWSWNFGDGSPLNTSAISPSHLYQTPGTYTVTLITNSSNLGCADTLSSTITAYPVPVANFNFSDVCLIDSVEFSDLSSVSSGNIVSRSWNFGDGSPLSTATNPHHKYTNSNSFNVTLIVTTDNGCMDTISKIVVVHAMPIINYSVGDVCFQQNVLFMNSTTILPTDTIQYYAWNMGDGSPLQNVQNTSHNYAASGSYTTQLKAVSTFGCVDSMSIIVDVFPKPIANFTSNDDCSGITTAFIDASSTSSGTISSWFWDFGDNTTPATTQSPSHLYTEAGVKQVTLIVNNSFGCIDTITKNTTIFFNPIASFTYSNVCSGDTMYFTNTSTVDTSAIITSYIWGFGDSGPNSFIASPSHYYVNPGNYTVTLIAQTDDGCSSAAIVPVNAFDAPTSLFSVSDGCQTNTFSFTNNSLPPTAGNIASWSWNFGDGSALNTTTQNPNHNYNQAGVYEVTLITYSSNLGCSDTLKDSVTVFNSPNAAFGYYEVCVNQSMSFMDSSTVGGTATITSWNWNFGSGYPTSTAQNPSNTFSSYGLLPVKLIVTTINNCMDSVTQNVLVHPNPTATISAPNTCFGDLTAFTDLSTIPSNPTNDLIQTRIWNFGDGSPNYNNTNPFRMYPDTGTYTIQFIIASSFGCMDSTTETIIIHPKPLVNFTSSDTLGCEPLCISFQQMASISKGNNVAYLWNWGDNTMPDTTLNPGHCFVNNNAPSMVYYNVSLTVVSDSGCATIHTKNNYIAVQPQPDIAFSVLPSLASIVNSTVEIADSTIGATLWEWNFGDDSTHTDTLVVTDSLFHTYADTGSYNVTLIATSALGCKDTAYRNVYIAPDVTIYIPSGFSPNGDGKNEIFVPVGIAINKFEMSIYNRWGNFVFYTDDINEGWDGKFKNGGALAQEDTYVYVIRIVDGNKKKHYFRGAITLVR
ncbi:MAG: PKD domain-containing protein [Bacteroidia bacterium]